MDATTLVSASATAGTADKWKSQKRIPDRESDLDNDDLLVTAPDATCMGTASACKRFKGSFNESVFESPVNVSALLVEGPKKSVLYRGLQYSAEQGVHHVLSPITEISKNLSEASLNKPCIMNRVSASNATPLRGEWRNAIKRKLHDDAKMKLSSLQLEMNNEELSLFNDNSIDADNDIQRHKFTKSSLLMDTLLSPESSPRRFQYIDETTCNTDSCDVSNSNAQNFNKLHSLSCDATESSVDDDYMELFEIESLQQPLRNETTLDFPTDLHALISGTIKNENSQVITPEMRRPSVRRCLSMQTNQHPLNCEAKTPEFLKQIDNMSSSDVTPFSSHRMTSVGKTKNILTRSNAFKCPETPNACNENNDEVSQVNAKMSTAIASKNSLMAMRKCLSMNDADIMSALARAESQDEPELIGDFSKPFCLPLMEGRHRDLKSISSHTVARLINGDFDDQIASYCIIDCRYPYEYEGGHIRGAKNIYTHEQIIEEFLTQQKTEEQRQQQAQTQTESAATYYNRNILIFHCEFSSERGPKLSRFLRNNDRTRNTNSYPALDYPEMYLLHNGYKEFYETHSELCEPNSYTTMLEPAFNEAYRHFRAKSKSWNGDGSTTTRLKKSRSRLML